MNEEELKKQLMLKEMLESRSVTNQMPSDSSYVKEIEELDTLSNPEMGYTDTRGEYRTPFQKFSESEPNKDIESQSKIIFKKDARDLPEQDLLKLIYHLQMVKPSTNEFTTN